MGIRKNWETGDDRKKNPRPKNLGKIPSKKQQKNLIKDLTMLSSRTTIKASNTIQRITHGQGEVNMNYTTHNDTVERIELAGSHLQGEIQANYIDLVDAFGEPTTGDEYKTDAEWAIVFEDGTRATIYNWKDGKNYMGEDGTPTDEIKDWHIGGFNSMAVQRVREVLDCVFIAEIV
jgi:hypothetical protein